MLKVYVPYPSVVFGREVLGEVISKVFGSLLPVQAELILFNFSAHPVGLHVKGLGEFPANFAGEDDVGGRAVGLDWGGQLRVAHRCEGSAGGDGLLSIEENHTGFCFHGGSHDGADVLTLGEYWTIRGQSWENIV